MSRAFIEGDLFKPFTSTKKAGFGIGMYQCRDWIERWHGRLDVASEPGAGTTIRMTLPLAEEARPSAGELASLNDLDRSEERAA